MSASYPRIVVHDYSGHPGQAQLSRTLAGRGYHVIHQHCPSYTTGKGSLERQPGDPATLAFEPCSMAKEFNRYAFTTRIRQEIAYGRQAARLIMASQPDVVILSNVPLFAHVLIARYLRQRRVPMVFWMQDIYSEAITATARNRFGALGLPVGWIAQRLERRIARASEGVVAISSTFFDTLRRWRVEDKTTLAPNWAPIEELPVCHRDNGWRERMGLEDRPVVLYSGTLGLKHDPSILAMMASELEHSHPDARVVVISEGKGREWLEQWKREQQADNLLLFDYQPYSDLPEVLASADVLVAILEPDASKFSIPSKVLTYLCTQRAILGVIPPDNSVAQVLVEQGAGLVVHPSRRMEIAARVTELLHDGELRQVMGQAGRQYAEVAFSPERVADQFIEIFDPWVTRPFVEDEQVKPTFAHAAAARSRASWATPLTEAAG